MMLPCLLFVAVVGSSSAFLFDADHSNWDAFRVHWGFNPLSSENFVYMPRTTEEAMKKGFKKISECDEKANWRGARYVKDDDNILILLFDKNGYIAGTQTKFPPTADYPKPNIQPPFIKDGDDVLLTAYFVDPATICSTGRNEIDYKKQGTGTNLYIQNGTDPEKNTFMIPRKQDDLANTMWTEGKCFVTMGKHYWYNTSENMNCDDFLPVFLMYNGGHLTGFGWAMGTSLESIRLEHPKSSTLDFFFNEVPKCMKKTGSKFSTMHIYLTSKVLTNTC